MRQQAPDKFRRHALKLAAAVLAGSLVFPASAADLLAAPPPAATGLGAGKYDVIIGQVGITPKRLEAFDFSEPYTYSSPQLIVRKDEKAHYASLADLKGKRLGMGQGSVFEQQAKAAGGIDVKSYPAAPENLQDQAVGRIDATLNDSVMVAYLLSNSEPGPTAA